MDIEIQIIYFLILYDCIIFDLAFDGIIYAAPIVPTITESNPSQPLIGPNFSMRSLRYAKSCHQVNPSHKSMICFVHTSPKKLTASIMDITILSMNGLSISQSTDRHTRLIKTKHAFASKIASIAFDHPRLIALIMCSTSLTPMSIPYVESPSIHISNVEPFLSRSIASTITHSIVQIDHVIAPHDIPTKKSIILDNIHTRDYTTSLIIVYHFMIIIRIIMYYSAHVSYFC